MPFKALGLAPQIIQSIQEVGYTEPTPIQSAAIPKVLEGGDIIGIAQTGTGKTAAFTLPILNFLAKNPQTLGKPSRTRVLVLAPTRELVAQIEENVLTYAKHLPLKIAKIYGGVGENPQKAALRHGSDIVIACPGRLLDLMNQGCADFSKLEHLVLDEADRMLDMGFLPDIRRVISKLPKKRQTLLFSATLSKEIEALTHEFQHHPKTVQVGKRSNPAETVTQFVYEAPKHRKMDLLIHLLEDEKLQMVLVFSRTKHGADKIARKLQQSGTTCATIHANRTQNQRLRALADFKAWKIRVLVATDIAARGIDVDGISHVVNFDFPHIVEDYVHRIGRTGRAQAIGDAISFVCQEELNDLRKLERFIGRGLVRKRAEGFDYNAAEAPVADSQPRYRDQRQEQARGNSRTSNRSQGPRRDSQDSQDRRSSGNASRQDSPKRTDAGGQRQRQGQRNQSRPKSQSSTERSTQGEDTAKADSGVRALWNRIRGK